MSWDKTNTSYILLICVDVDITKFNHGVRCQPMRAYRNSITKCQMWIMVLATITTVMIIIKIVSAIIKGLLGLQKENSFIGMFFLGSWFLEIRDANRSGKWFQHVWLIMAYSMVAYIWLSIYFPEKIIWNIYYILNKRKDLILFHSWL